MHDLQFFIDLRSSINLLRQRHVGTHMFEKQYQDLNLIIETAKTTENGTFILCPICGDELIPDYDKEEEDKLDPDACPRCEGRGTMPHDSYVTCPDCGGTGNKPIDEGESDVEEESTEDLNDGDDLICPICNGLGEDPRTDKICTSCHGQGWKKEGHVEDE